MASERTPGRLLDTSKARRRGDQLVFGERAIMMVGMSVLARFILSSGTRAPRLSGNSPHFLVVRQRYGLRATIQM
jgi:hypothetical protein